MTFEKRYWRRLATSASVVAFTVGCVTLYQSYSKPLHALCDSSQQQTTSTPDRQHSCIRQQQNECKKLIKRYQLEHGVPGMIVAVSRNGQTLYARGFGYADVENGVKASASTCVRIASISKPLSCLVAAKLHEKKKLNLDESIYFYVDRDENSNSSGCSTIGSRSETTAIPRVPRLQFNGNECTVTARQLIAHTSGIRHYKEKLAKKTDDKQQQAHTELAASSDTELEEFYMNKEFKTTRDALNIFINDPLKFEPGSHFLYSTFGYTMLSYVLEKANGPGTTFSKLLVDLFKQLDMNETYLDENQVIMPNRAKYYTRNKRKRLVNVPCTDSSYKWAGGGVVSTVGDLLKFGNAMLRIYTAENGDVLTAATVRELVWAPQSDPKKQYKEPGDKKSITTSEPLFAPNEKTSYGLGWNLVTDELNRLKYVYHTGGAIGAVSCLLVAPSTQKEANESNGLVVAILCNSDSVTDIAKLALNVSRIFSNKK